LPFNLPKTRSYKRIGPHNLIILSILFGTLLGDSHAERTKHSTRIILQQEDSNIQYLKWFYHLLSHLGYCRFETPTKEIRIGSKGKIRYFYRLRTYSFSSFNWIHEAFYFNNHKRVPIHLLETYLTPIALAIWIKDDGTRNNNSLRFCTHSFTKQEVVLLGELLYKLYSITTSLHQQSPLKEQYKLYIKQESFNKLKEIVGPYMHKSKLYKLREER
jgi:ubiquinol-cytochrome c reductase cytochrome b subunit